MPSSDNFDQACKKLHSELSKVRDTFGSRKKYGRTVRVFISIIQSLIDDNATFNPTIKLSLLHHLLQSFLVYLKFKKSLTLKTTIEGLVKEHGSCFKNLQKEDEETLNETKEFIRASKKDRKSSFALNIRYHFFAENKLSHLDFESHSVLSEKIADSKCSHLKEEFKKDHSDMPLVIKSAVYHLTLVPASINLLTAAYKHQNRNGTADFQSQIISDLAKIISEEKKKLYSIYLQASLTPKKRGELTLLQVRASTSRLVRESKLALDLNSTPVVATEAPALGSTPDVATETASEFAERFAAAEHNKRVAAGSTTAPTAAVVAHEKHTLAVPENAPAVVATRTSDSSMQPFFGTMSRASEPGKETRLPATNRSRSIVSAI